MFVLNPNYLIGLNNPSEEVYIQKLSFPTFLKSLVDSFHICITTIKLLFSLCF